MKPHDEKRLRENVNRVMQARPGLLPSRDEILHLAELLQIDREGKRILSVKTSGGLDERVLYDASREPLRINQQFTLKNNFEQGKRFQVMAGIGIGHGIEDVVSLLENYPRCAVGVFEEDWMRWTAFLTLFDARQWMNCERMYLFSGQDAHRKLAAFMTEEYIHLLPSSQISYVLGHLPFYQEEAQSYMNHARQTADYMGQSSVSFENSMKTFLITMNESAKDIQTVWSCVSKQAYIHFPLAQAFLCGFEKKGLCSQLDPFDYGFTTNFRIVGHFVEYMPDLIFSINTWPDEVLLDLGFNDETVNSIHRPRVCWMVDDTRLYEDDISNAPLSDWNYIFCIDRTYREAISQRAKHVYFLPPASQFEKPGEYREQFSAPISYVGSLPDVMVHLQQLSSNLIEKIERIEQERVRDYRVSFVELWKRLESNRENDKQLLDIAREFCATTQKGFTSDRAILEYFLYNCATFTKRKRIVQALLPLGLMVFGPPAWKDWLPSKYKDRYGGFVAFEDLADCYASAKISLNIHSHQCPTCLNPRDFDASLAGSVVLGDWVEDIERDILRLGEEILAFHNEEEAKDIASMLLRDKERLEIIKDQAQKRIMSEHLYEHRARRVLEHIKTSKG